MRPQKRRLSDPTCLVLASLAAGPRHALGIQQDVEAFAGIRLGPGTLYGVIGRLEADGVIEALPNAGRRRPYRLTGAGSRFAQEQLQLASDAAHTGLQRLRSRA